VTPWRRSPRPVTLAIDTIRDELAPATLLADVQTAWPKAVGRAISAEAKPTAERAGVVTISCSAAVWAQELDLMAPAIVERLNESLGTGRIERLRCVAVPFSEDPY
jgi:predicted nucleic acid-binding Zn ribbon protein